MSVWKPLVLGLVICGTIATTVHADAISSWPSGLDNWVVYLAAPSGNPGSGPLAYTAPQPVTAAPPAASVSPVSPPPLPPTPVQTAPAPAAAASQPAAVQPAVYTPPATSNPPTPNPPPTSYTPPLSSQSPAVQTPTYTPSATSQPSMVQPVTYIHPMSSQPTSVQPVIYAPPTVVASSPVTNSQPAVAANNVSAVASPATPAASGSVQAFINVGNGPYPLAAAITTGGAQPWYNSSQLTGLFGGQPNAQQIQSFDNAILQRVQQTFSQSGIPVSLTENPNVAALHTISLVSNTGSSTLPSAIGMTQVGSNGFSFIDQIAPSAHSLDQLEWIVAHNVSHELMLAFGVPENYDTTGNYVDSKLANWAMMVNPSSTFSAAASQAITQALASQNQTSFGTALGAQEVNPSPAAIPEPTTVAMWGLAVLALFVSQRRNASLARVVRAA
jgi:hypothetical protein